MLVTVDAEEATCGECPCATRSFRVNEPVPEFVGVPMPCQFSPSGRMMSHHARRPACLAAERTHAEAIAQARREERAAIVARARAEIRDRVAAYGPDRPDVKLGAEALAWFADALEREPC